MRRTSDGGAPRRLAEAAGQVLRFVRSRRRSRSYPLVGVMIAPGAPLGLLVANALAAGRMPTLGQALQDVAQAPLTHAYLLLGTATLLALLGFLVGRWFDRARRLALTDPLTGLFNRRHFGERMAEELRQSLRHGRPTCVLCIDLDHLKAINDGSGHQAGDHAIVTVSRSLSRCVRSTDVVARIGGDEFALLLPRTSAAEASFLSQRILADVARHSELEQILTASIGIAELDAEADMNTDDFLAAADAALYRAKAAGGGRAIVSLLRSTAPTRRATSPSRRTRPGTSRPSTLRPR